MDRPEFDKFAEEYKQIHAGNISISGEDPEYFAEYKVRDIFDAYREARGGSDGIGVLDFGSGVGTVVPFLRRYFDSARIIGIDVSSKSLKIARRRFGDDAAFVQFDGETIPCADASIDLVLAACVFHHIDEREHVGLLTEFLRVLAPGGLAVVYEHNPFNPLTRHAVHACPFDENARLIRASTMRQRFATAGFSAPCVRYRVFFPSFARALRFLEPSLTRLPIGAQYFVAGRK